MIKFPHENPDIQAKMDLARALSYMANNQDCRAFIDWLRGELQRLDTENRGALNETVFRQRQGAAQTLDSLLEQFSMAQKTWSTLQAVREKQVMREIPSELSY